MPMKTSQPHVSRYPRRGVHVLVTLMLCALVSACLHSSPTPPDDSDDNGSENTAPANRDHGVRFVHAAPDGETVDIRVNGELAVSGLAYSRGTPYIIESAGGTELSGEMEFTVLPHEADPGDDALLSVTLDYDDDIRFTAFIESDGENLDLRMLDEHFDGEADDSAVLRFSHLISGAGPVDIYVDHGNHPDFESMTPTYENVAFGTTLDYRDAGIDESTRVIVTPTGESEILLDTVSSSSGRTLYFREGDRIHLVMMATDGEGFRMAPGFSSVGLLALVQSSVQGTAVQSIVDARARIQLIHAVSDAPAVDVLVGGEVIEELEYGDSSPGTILLPGDYIVELRDHDSGSTLEETEITLQRVSEYALVLVGSHDAGELDWVSARVNSLSSQIDEGEEMVYVHPIHAYFTYPQNVDMVFNDELVAYAQDLAYKQFADFPRPLEQASDSDEIQFLETGTFDEGDVVLAETDQTLTSGRVYTAILAGIYGNGSEAEILLIPNLVFQD